MILTEAVADYRSFNKMKRNLTNAEPLDLGHEGIDAFIRMKTGRIATLSDVVESARINGVTERAVHADLSSAVENKIIAIPRSKEKRDFVLNVHADDVERILHLRNSRSEVVWSFTKRNVRH
jgi:hypothetical protein